MTTRILPTGAGLLLQTYLNDHRAGAAAGLALCERLARNNDGNELGRTATELRADIADDAEALDRIVGALGLRQNPVK